MDNYTPRLTPRETEALRLASEGLSDQAIAKRMVLATCSVENLLYTVYQKMGFTKGGHRNPRVAAARWWWSKP